MKRITTAFLFASLIASCINPNATHSEAPSTKDTITNTVVDTLEQPSQLGYELDDGTTQIVVKNSSHYSEKFVKGLQGIGLGQVALLDSLFIVDGDTIPFSPVPAINRNIVLTGKVDDLAVALTVKRINYTTIDYRIEMVEAGKSNHTQSGQAEIPSTFFWGEESDDSPKTGMSYFVTEYSHLVDDDCHIDIRLGYEEETGPYLLGKLVKNCNGEIRDIDLDDMFLIEK